MLDFAALKTPPNHGDVLVAPEPELWIQAARENHRTLGAADTRLLDSTLACWRRRTREAIVGNDDVLVFVLGHQPEFAHPGVWAKHVAAVRSAAAADGIALNLVVDNDAPKRTVLTVPAVQGKRLVTRSVPFASLAGGLAYEQLAKQTPGELDTFERQVCEALGERYDRSQMPTFIRGMRQAADASDWVDQAVTGRRAVEREMGITLTDRRVSEVWCSPLLLDMLVNAERFAVTYNRALASYRRRYRVRGDQRPIPDLRIDRRRCELPVWAYRTNERRRRLFVEHRGTAVRLFADDAEVGLVPADHVSSCDGLDAMLTDLPGWRLRPRALALTIWARLLLADLFIHGIGGAQYDRISDTVISDYYGVTPPHMVCVSATLHLDLPHPAAAPETLRRLQHGLRDLVHNPQRHVQPGADLDPLLKERREAVAKSVQLREHAPRDRESRRRVFGRIRALNTAIRHKRPDLLLAQRQRVAQGAEDVQQARIAQGREYFFGFFDRGSLERLLEALPGVQDFRV